MVGAERVSLEERAGSRAPQQPHHGEAGQAGQPGEEHRQHAILTLQLRRRQDEQHGGHDARPVPAPADRPRHPQPQGDRDQAEDYDQRDGERGRGDGVPAEPSKGVAHEGQRSDQEHRGGAGGGPVHELDRGQHRCGSRRPQQVNRLASGRAGLVRGGLCDGCGVPGRIGGDRGDQAPSRWQAARKAPAVYSLPRSVCMMTPGTWPPRTATAMASAP
jgi:hypothetical protein